jgi:uncharacterized repeat protein (TIGR01451 family)
MSREPDFESSADMRLLELQRSALGLAAPTRAAWESRYSADATPGTERDAAEEPVVRGAVLAVALTATPPGDVIPGTVLTYALSLSSEGAQTATDVTASVPLPSGATYRAGSLHINGRSAEETDAEQLFGAGLELGGIDAGSRVTLLWKVGVKMGTAALVAVPQVRARGTGIIGGAPVVVERKYGTTAFAGELAAADRVLYEPKPLIPVEIPVDELPIYELDTEEEILYEAADAALSDAVPKAAAEPAVEASAPREADIEDVDDVEEAPAREAVILYGGLDRPTIAFFERVFNGSKPPTILQHCIFASALACAADSDGNDTIGLRAHLAAQSQILHRVSLHEKLGKREPIGEYAGELLAQIDAIAPKPVRDVARADDRVVLANELHEPALAVVRKIAEERGRWDFVKARQLTLALQAQRAFVADDGRAASLDNALRSYAQTSMTVLQKLFVRLRLDKTTGVLFQTDTALDLSARALLAACSAALPR